MMNQTGLVTTYPDDGCERCNEKILKHGRIPVWNYTEDTFCDDCYEEVHGQDFHFYKLLDGSQYKLRKLLEWENL